MKKVINSDLENFYHYYSIKDWKKAGFFLRREIKKGDNSGWIWSRLSSIYYEQRKYKLAFRYAIKAIKINPNSALILWDYAGSLYGIKKYKEAKKIYLKILKYSDYEIGKYYTGLGIAWAKSVKNDSNFKLSQISWILNRDSEALRYYKLYKNGKKKKIKSIYDKPTLLLHENRLLAMEN